MAGKGAVLAIRIVSDASKAARGFDEASRTSSRFEGAMGRVGTAVAAAGLGQLAVDAFQAASALEQSAGAIETVFGSAAPRIAATAREAAQAVGLSANSYQELASVMGSQLKNMGISTDQLVPKTEQLISLGADLAATYGGTTADAVAALSSLLRGETDPIERYGVSIKAADIAARLAANGQDELTGTALKAAQANAVLGLIAQQTGSAVGAFGREADTAAGQTQRASAAWENAQAALGEALLPVVTVGAEKLASLAEWISKNSEVVVPLIAGLAALAAVVWLVNFAMAANPVVLIVLAIGAAILAVTALMLKFEGFRTFMVRVAEVVTAPFRAFWSLLQGIGDFVGGFVNGLGLGGVFGAAGARPAMAAAGLYGAAGGSYEPARQGLYGASGTSSGTAGPGGTGGARLRGDTYNITIEGAIDPGGTADTIRGLLDRRDVLRGRSSGLIAGKGAHGG